MPYITQEERDKLDPIIFKLWKWCEQKRGRINYCCTRLVHLWCIEEMRKIKSFTKKYDIVNDAHGILNCIRDEFYSAVVVPYERLKSKENGAVSQLDMTADGAEQDKRYCLECGRSNINLDERICLDCGSKKYRKAKLL